MEKKWEFYGGIALLSTNSKIATYILRKLVHFSMQKPILKMLTIIRNSKVWQVLSHLNYNKMIALEAAINIHQWIKSALKLERLLKSF